MVPEFYRFQDIPHRLGGRSFAGTAESAQLRISAYLVFGGGSALKATFSKPAICSV